MAAANETAKRKNSSDDTGNGLKKTRATSPLRKDSKWGKDNNKFMAVCMCA
ncbi:hypothetical protein SARC_18000, partial [Sphaeroforma arctica JP610]